MKFYVAFSIHGTNQFRVAVKSARSIEALGPDFRQAVSRRDNYNASRDGVKVHWNKLIRKDGTPLESKCWVSKRFNQLVALGWREVTPKQH